MSTHYERMVAGLDKYARHGVPTGGFLKAVLANDLAQAVGRADEESIVELRDIVRYVYNHLPATCWGSYERVEEWLTIKRAEAKNAEA